jgi:hypothetical protein
MAQRKKQAAARKRNAAMRGKARKPAKSVRGKTAKRTSAKAKSKKRATKTKKRAVAKTMVPKAESVVVDIVEEPVPGVTVVTEFEATEIRGPNAKPEQSEESRGAAPPESEE